MLLLSSCVFNKDLRDINIYLYIFVHVTKKWNRCRERDGYEEGKKKKNEKIENDRKEGRKLYLWREMKTGKT